MRRFGLWMLVALAAAGMAAPAMADHSSMREAFRKMDSNENGSLSVYEFMADRGSEQGERARRQFERLDIDRSGELNFAEFRSMQRETPGI